ncbi:MAG: T9SS type A sorting domain-containing protein [Crocinitomix sp.]|nr:T9SS type A sorting domain-containing protein [Crocinitomix sp.]
MKRTATIFTLILLLVQYSAMAQLAKGDRVLAWQVDVAENDDYDIAFGFAEDACQESTHLALSWSALEPDDGVFDPAYIASPLDIINIYYPLKAVQLELQIAVTNTTNKEVPADLAAVPFDSPEMIERFKIALDTIFEHIPDVDLAALNIGNESDILFGTDESQYNAFKTFLDAIVPYAKTTYFDLHGTELKVGTALTLSGLTNPDLSAYCQILNEGLDIVTVTYYPLGPAFTMEHPSVVEGNFDELVAHYPSVDQPIYFAECGYSSSETCLSSEALQAEFYTAVFEAWDKHYDNIKYLTIFKSTDWSNADVEFLSEYYGIDDPIFLEYLRTLGVRTWDGDGTNKLAYEFILCELKARDWCAVDCALTEVQSLTSPSAVRLFPNPASDRVSIQSEIEIAEINIYNSLGEAIITTNDSDIEVNTLPAGIYFVYITFADHSFTNLKFTKQ